MINTLTKSVKYAVMEAPTWYSAPTAQSYDDCSPLSHATEFFPLYYYEKEQLFFFGYLS